MWECFQASAVEAVSQSQVEEWMWGSFIQSHWPCRTLCPISMFSRILAAESAAVPAIQAGRLAGGEQQHAADHGQPPLHLDHALDVAAVAVAEVGEDPVADRVELARQLVELLLGEVRERALALGIYRCGGGTLIGLPFVGSQSAISIGPSGALTQVRTISPSLPWTSPVRRSRTSPEQSRPTQVWQMPIRQPKGSVGAGLLAGDEDRRAAVAARSRPRSW